MLGLVLPKSKQAFPARLTASAGAIALSDCKPANHLGCTEHMRVHPIGRQYPQWLHTAGIAHNQPRQATALASKCPTVRPDSRRLARCCL